MKHCTLFLILNFILTISYGQNWSAKADIPGGINKRMAATSFTIYDTTAFVLGGLKSSGWAFVTYNDFWKYEADNDTWIQKSNFPGGPKYAHISFVIDSIAYVGCGGNQFGSLSSQFWAYNINTDAWTPIASFPGAGRVYASAMTIGSKGYIVRGVKFVGGNTVYLDDFWEYDPISNSWTQKSNYPGGLRAGTIAFGIGTQGYMGLGESDGFFQFDFYAYDPLTDIWTQKTGTPTSPISFASAVVLFGKAYILGGEFAHLQYTSNVWEYNPNNNVWTPSASFPGTPRRNAISFVVNNEIYYGTGQIGSSEANVEDDLWVLANITAIHEKERSSLTIFPNPTSGQLSITLEEASKGIISISNNLGQTIKLQAFNNAETVSIEFEGPAGMYFLQLEIDGEVITKKIIKE